MLKFSLITFDALQIIPPQELWRSFSVQKFQVPERLQRATASTSAPTEAPSAPPPPQTTSSPQVTSREVTSRDREVTSRDREVTSRDREAQEEAFRLTTDWAFTVLGAARSYRNLMRKLHPDKVTITEGVEKTTALIREAKDLCEKSFSKIVAPGAPRGLRYEVLEHEIGHRRYRLRLHPSLDGFGLDFILTTHETRLAAT
eukprot:symbB.v1.2.016572.t1/scaffold1263.1/size128093/12